MTGELAARTYFMLPKKLRLPIKDFSPPNKKISFPFFTLKFKKNNLGYNRFGVIISLKVDKRSSRRNFWKRRFFEDFKNWPNLSSDFLFIVQPTIKNASKEDLKVQLKSVISKLRFAD